MPPRLNAMLSAPLARHDGATPMRALLRHADSAPCCLRRAARLLMPLDTDCRRCLPRLRIALHEKTPYALRRPLRACCCMRAFTVCYALLL